MELKQNDLERLLDKLDKGELTADQANVEKVRIQRVLLVTSKIPSSVRQALNAAVKRGELGHMRKELHKPEVYYHPAFEYLVAGERNEYERRVLKALAGVVARPLEHLNA